jgi:ribosomal protein S18 acetylase RimI-like enzyme
MKPTFRSGNSALLIYAEQDWLLQLNNLWRRIGWKERTEAQWNSCLAKSECVLTIWLGDRIIGLGRMVTDGIFVTFYDIAIDPRHQRRGLGTRLMEMLIDRVKDEKYAGIYLFRWEENQHNKAFYEKLGFVETPVGMELKQYMSPE